MRKKKLTLPEGSILTFTLSIPTEQNKTVLFTMNNVFLNMINSRKNQKEILFEELEGSLYDLEKLR